MAQYYVNTTCTAGGDGTTASESGATRAYESLATFESERDGTPGENVFVDCSQGTSGGADTTVVVFTGWTLSTYYIEVRANTNSGDPGGDQSHNGVWNTGVYELYPSASAATKVVSLQNAGEFRFTNLQIGMTHSGTYVTGNILIYDYSTNNVDFTVNRCLFTKADTGTGNRITAILSGFYSGTKIVKNSLFYDFISGAQTGLTAIGHDSTDGTYHVANNTFHNCEDCFNSQTGDECYNNIFEDFDTSGGYDLNGGATNQNNVTDVASGSSGLSAVGGDNNVFSSSLTFVDKANDDFHLVVGDTDAIGAAQDLSATSPYSFSDDIDGDTRSSWDSGFDEYIAAGGGLSIPIIMRDRRMRING